MHHGWTTGLVLVLLSACTRPNPAFEELTDGDPTTSVATSVGDSEGSATPASTEGDTTRGMSGPNDDSATRGDSGPECTLEFRDAYGFVSEPTLEEMFPDCPETPTMTVLGSVMDDGTRFMGQRCPSCSCAQEFPISMTFEVPLTEVDGGCFEVRFHLEPGSCKLLAYTFVPSDGGLPPVIVSNVVSPAVMSPLDIIDLGETSSEPCTERSCEPPDPIPGRYPLVIGGMEVPPGTDEPMLVGPYTVFNDDSGVDLDCQEVARWHAHLDPP